MSFESSSDINEGVPDRVISFDVLDECIIKDCYEEIETIFVNFYGDGFRPYFFCEDHSREYQKLLNEVKEALDNITEKVDKLIDEETS